MRGRRCAAAACRWRTPDAWLDPRAAQPSWQPFSAPRGFEAGGGAAPRRAAAAASAFADVPGSGWGGFEGQGAPSAARPLARPRHRRGGSQA
jgi:hypothetical protein